MPRGKRRRTPSTSALMLSGDEGGPVGMQLAFHVCNYCQKPFKHKAHLEVHLRVHTGERPYRCGDCGKCFTQLANLQVHRRRHTGERPYACSYCEKRFIQLSNLQAHTRTHTGEKPYTCDLCGNKFAQLSNLKSHGKTHFRGAGMVVKRKAKRPKTFQCQECGDTFEELEYLYTHMRSHNIEIEDDQFQRITCDYCGENFKRKSALKKHIQEVHQSSSDSDSSEDDDDVYKCDLCDIIFDDDALLNDHNDKVHRYERQHICCYCGRRFPNSATLSAHTIECQAPDLAMRSGEIQVHEVEVDIETNGGDEGDESSSGQED